MSTVCDSMIVEMKLPSRAITAAGGPFGEEFLWLVSTRIPLRNAAATQIPSLLAYFMQKKSIIQDVWLDWIAGVADHALVVAEVRGVVKQRPSRRGKWHCRDWHSAVNRMFDNAGGMKECKSPADCISFFSSAQAVLQDVLRPT